MEPKVETVKKPRRNEKETMVDQLNKLVKGAHEEDEVKSISSFHSEASLELRENPRKFMFQEIFQLVDAEAHPEKYEKPSKSSEKAERPSEPRTPGKKKSTQVVMKDEEKVRSEVD